MKPMKKLENYAKMKCVQNWMKNKKKIIIAVLLVVLFVVEFLGYQQYQVYRKNKNEEYYKYSTVYSCINTKKYGDSLPFFSNALFKELKNNPPKVEMNGNHGLYVSAMAYEYYTGNTLDYLAIEKLMNSGSILEVYTLCKDYFEWFEKDSFAGRFKRNGYGMEVSIVAQKEGIDIYYDSSYEDYKKVIETYPEEIAAILNR